MKRYESFIIRNHIIAIYKEWQNEDENFFIDKKQTQSIEKVLRELNSNSNIFHVIIYLLFDYFYELDVKSISKKKILILLTMLFEEKSVFEEQFYKEIKLNDKKMKQEIKVIDINELKEIFRGFFGRDGDFTADVYDIPTTPDPDLSGYNPWPENNKGESKY